MDRRKLVVLTGAGISAESGLRTFRDSDGLWEGYNIEDVATPRAWRRDRKLVLDFYNMRRRDAQKALPNKAHLLLAELESHFDVTIVTQNIDDLHERAGSTNVLHLHGEIMKMRSEKNEHKLFPVTGDINEGDLAEDGGHYRPHVVWFEEPVPMIEKAIPIMQHAGEFILIGSSLAVYPAAGLVGYVPYHVTKYVIDKKIPYVGHISNVHKIEKPATDGMQELADMLLS